MISVAFEVRVLAASTASPAGCENGHSSFIGAHSPDSNFGSINFCRRAPKPRPPANQAAYVAAVFGLVLSFYWEKVDKEGRLLEMRYSIF